jgi:hypothetical protein
MNNPEKLATSARSIDNTVAKCRGQKDKHWSTKHYTETKDLTTQTTLKTTGETRCLVESAVSTLDVAPDELFFNLFL